MKIALCVNEDYKSVELNAAYMEEKIIEASYNDADLIIFPNYSFNIYPTGVLKDDIEEFDMIDDIIKDLKMFASNYAIYVVFGYNYFDGTKIKNTYKVISYEGSELDYDFMIEKTSFSLNNYSGEYVIDLEKKELKRDKKIFQVNKLFKDVPSGGAIYYFNEVIKEIKENVESMVYISFNQNSNVL